MVFKGELLQIGKGKRAARYCKSDEVLFSEAQASKERGNGFFKA